ncbi:MAG: septal ring-binding cell division protein DamX [Cyclobacteriaceae bacterium]
MRQTIEPDESVFESTLHFSQSLKTMPGWTNYLVLALLTVLLSSCQTFNNSLDKIGGMFTKDKGAACKGDDCEDGGILDNSNTNQSWFCYGEVRGAEWDCQNRPDASKVVATVDPATIEPITFNPVAILPVADDQIAAPQPERQEITAAPTQAQAISDDVVAVTVEPTVVPDTSMVREQEIEQEIEQAPEPASNVPAAINPSLPSLVGGSETLLSQPENFYTVQVIAMRSEENVLTYARLNGMQYPLYTRIANDDGPWYVLLLGVYPDVNTAQQAMTDWLRAKSLKVNPWVRQLGALQESIRHAQQYE